MGEPRVFVALGQAISPETVERQSPPAGQKELGNLTPNNLPSDGCLGVLDCIQSISVEERGSVIAWLPVVCENDICLHSCTSTVQ